MHTEDDREFEDDSEFEEEIRRAAAHFDPVPHVVLQQAMEAFAWGTFEDEVAELVFDSLMDPRDAALVRGGEESRSLTFRTGALSIEIEVTRTRSSLDVIGQLIPPQEMVVEIRHQGGSIRLEADELGRFAAPRLRAGPFSLRCGTADHADGGHVVTEWIRL